MTIKKLDLSKSKSIDNVDWSDINPEAIEELDLIFSKITSQELIALLQKLCNLKILNASRCRSINNIHGLAFSLNVIEEFYLRGSAITSQGLVALLQKMRNLKYLDLGECDSIDNVEGLDINLDTIEELYLDDATITSQGIVALLQKMRNLKKLKLSGCQSVSDVDWLCITADAIENLDLEDSTITSKGLVDLLQKMSKLKKLNLAGCKSINNIEDLDVELAIEEIDLRASAITLQGLVALLQKMPHIKKLHFDVNDMTRLIEGVPVNEELKYMLFSLLRKLDAPLLLKLLVNNGFKESHDIFENCLIVRKHFYQNYPHKIDVSIFSQLYSMLQGEELNPQALSARQKFIEDGLLRVILYKHGFSILKEDIDLPSMRHEQSTPLTWAQKSGLPGVSSRLIKEGASMKLLLN